MKPSNVQTKSIVFGGIDIQPSTEDIDNAQGFDWDGVNIGIQSKYKQLEPKTYSLFLRVAVKNDAGKVAPYSVDVLALGLFEFLGSDPEERIEDLTVVNGLSILYGTIREMVTTITSRMPHGAICLPGGNFMDHRPSLKKNGDPSPPEAVKAPKKQPTKRKPAAS